MRPLSRVIDFFSATRQAAKAILGMFQAAVINRQAPHRHRPRLYCHDLTSLATHLVYYYYQCLSWMPPMRAFVGEDTTSEHLSKVENSKLVQPPWVVNNLSHCLCRQTIPFKLGTEVRNPLIGGHLSSDPPPPPTSQHKL